MKRGWHVHSKVNEEEFKKIIKLRKGDLQTSI